METDYSDTDSEAPPEAHKKILNSALNLTNQQHVQASIRSESTLKLSEFDLMNVVKFVQVTDLGKVVGNDTQGGKKIAKTQHKVTTALPPEQEVVTAERVRRGVAYKNIKDEISKWQPIVQGMRSSTHSSFPLNSDSKLDGKAEGKRWKCRNMLKLDLNVLEAIDSSIPVENGDEDYAITLAEIMERRKEAAKIRAQTSYQNAKARRQNKIKSKKFHRMQKKEKRKKQLQEFELLQKANPEAAMEKLEEIERARAEERMTLRHKHTGQWAKSKLVRAKYDRETRQQLAQQLNISRELTQKLKVSDDDKDEEYSRNDISTNKSVSNNPWQNANLQTSAEVNQFLDSYRKYWDLQNGRPLAENNVNSTAVLSEQENPETTMLKSNTNSVDNAKNATKKKNTTVVRAKDTPSLRSSSSTMIISSCGSIWQVQDVVESDIDEQFLSIDRIMRKKVEGKYKELMSGSKNGGNDHKNSENRTKGVEKKKAKLTAGELFALPQQNLRPVIDEQLDETSYRHKGAVNGLNHIDGLNGINCINGLKGTVETTSTNSKSQHHGINSSKIVQSKTTKLDTKIPDLMQTDDNVENDQRGAIAEAFQNDNAQDDFQKDKQTEIENGTPKSIDLSLPGWGAWSGGGIKNGGRKAKRFVVKFTTEQVKRKDNNKGKLILNENGNSKVRSHLVSEVPFPFKNVKDYEASIRAPIGSTFVPETAFRRLTKPAVTTKMGTVIEPMHEDMLIKKK